MNADCNDASYANSYECNNNINSNNDNTQNNNNLYQDEASKEYNDYDK